MLKRQPLSAVYDLIKFYTVNYKICKIICKKYTNMQKCSKICENMQKCQK